jgi:CyaY protein
MSETQFLRMVEATLAQVETAIESARIAAECSQSALILTIEFDDGAKIILNAQTPMRQLWMASRGGALHFAQEDGQWKDTRTGQEFFAALSQAVSAALGTAVQLRAA